MTSKIETSLLLQSLESGTSDEKKELAKELAGRWLVQQINGQEKISDDLVQKLQELSLSVDFTTATSVVDGNLQELSRLNITSLNLSGQHQITDAAMKQVAEMANLRELILSGLRLLGAPGLANLKAILPKLQKLDLSRCDQVNNLNALSECQSLQSLSLSNCPKVLDRHLDVLKQLPIEKLEIKNCRGLTATGVFSRLSGHPTLKELDISGNSSWKQDKIDEFKNKNNTILVKS